MPFGAAVTILYGNASVDEHTQENVDSPQVKELMAKVSCVQDPELEKVFPAQWPATVEIVTKDGRKFATRVDYPKGDYKNPLSWDELIAKFDTLSSLIYPQDKRGEILARLKKLEDERKMANFCALLLRG
jgi:2-methylcitrate dehydratase PrpD